MDTPESKIERYLQREVKSRGGICWKFLSSISGVPDRIVIYRGRVIFVETKARTGRLTALQRIRHAELRAQGAEVVTLSSTTEVDEFLRHLIA